jgi:hypothetical protein
MPQQCSCQSSTRCPQGKACFRLSSRATAASCSSNWNRVSALAWSTKYVAFAMTCGCMARLMASRSMWWRGRRGARTLSYRSMRFPGLSIFHSQASLLFPLPLDGDMVGYSWNSCQAGAGTSSPSHGIPAGLRACRWQQLSTFHLERSDQKPRSSEIGAWLLAVAGAGG